MDLGAAFDDLLAGAAASDHLTLDLRGNPGRSLVAATALRDRFLRVPTRVGAIRFSTGTGTLAPPHALRAEPSERPRRPGYVMVLVDEMPYSAAEDCVLGLQGLEHITVTPRDRRDSNAAPPPTRAAVPDCERDILFP